MAESTVKVRGTGRAAGAPDQGRVTLRIEATGPTNEEAFEEIGRRSRLAEELFTELGIPHEAIQSSLQMNDFNRGEGPREVEAQNNLTVVVPNKDLAAQLITRAVRECAAAISGPYWELEPGNELHHEALRRAAEDARSKAEAHAAALGVRLGPVLEVKDYEGGFKPEHDRLGHFSTHQYLAPPPAFQIFEGQLEVDVSIEVTFALEAGGA
jgi:uncharacterized protein